MQLLLRLAFLALVAVSLVGCESAANSAATTAGGAANLLTAPLDVLARTASRIGGGSGGG